MKRIFAILSVLVFATNAFAQEPISDPNLVQVREAKDFRAIHVGSAFKVYLTKGNEEKVAVSAASDKDLAHIIVEVKNHILYVGWDSKAKERGNKKLKAYISCKNLDELFVSGACNVDIQGTLKVEGDLKIDLSGASDLEGKIEIGNKLEVDLNGASDAKFTGSARKMSIDASGASRFRGFDFTADYCDATASGASDIKITVNKELNAEASGASAVGYKGAAVIGELKTSGAGSVSRS